jgi:hypothetical protein
MEVKTITRQELYDMVWEEPMTTLSKRYGLSDNGLRKICLRMRVPLPKAGHWMKVKAGKKVKKVTLPEHYKGEQQLRLSVGQDTNDYDPYGLAALNSLQRDLEEKHASLLTVPERLTGSHPLTTAAKEAFDRKRKDKTYNGLYSCDGKLNVYVSPAMAPRAFRFMDTLVKALQALGHETVVDNRGSFAVISGERIEIGVRERQNKHMVNRGTWTSAEYTPSGTLVFWYKYIHTKEWADDTKLLEERLSRIIASLILKGRKELHERLERERRHAEREERERARREVEELQERELSRVKSLILEAERWRQAKVMREYANEVESTARSGNSHTDQLGEWAEWVRKKADWHDPQVKGPDELLTEVNWETMTLKTKPSSFFY